MAGHRQPERLAGVIPEVPILVGLLQDGAPAAGGALDVRVIDFMNHSLGAAVCSPMTAQVLRYQLPVFFRWLTGRGRSWDAATTQDFVAYKAHRTRLDRVAGATWDKDHWALSRFYGWAVAERLVGVNPVPPRQRRERGRSRYSASNKPPCRPTSECSKAISPQHAKAAHLASTRYLPRPERVGDLALLREGTRP